VLKRSTIACCFILLLGTGPACTAVSGQQSKDLPTFVYTAAKSYEPLAWMHGDERFPAGAAIFIRDGNGRRPLLPDFASSADAVVSFDGEQIMFAGKIHAADPWQIWETSLQGGAPRRITSGSEDCVRPFYLPDDRVVYARKLAGRFVIEVTDLGGVKPLALTYTPANALPTDILRDGRILFSAGYPLGAGATPEIYTVYSDGSGVEAYRCDHALARHSGKQSQSGDLIFVSPAGLSRFTSARAQGLQLPAPSGEYGGGLAEISDGKWLVSWRVDNRDYYRLMLWQQGTQALQPLEVEQGINLLQPVLVAPRATPNRHPSGLHDWPNANLLCLNAYTSKYPFAPGSIHSVRVYTRDSQGNSKLLGEAAVERDGSFFVQVPNEQPLQIELLDAAGKTLKRQSGFFWMRRGEQRACVGCHAGPETAPENAVPQILLKSTTPTNMTGVTAENAAGGH
jgi:hypothetical protein